MGRYIFLLSCILFFFRTTYAQSHGLQFSSHEVVPEKRTSLNLTPSEPVCFSNTTELSFDINFRPNLETYFGYVLRMITSDNQNIDVVYNQKLLQFNFIIGETFSFPFRIDSARLHGQWNTMKILVNEKSNSISFFLNDKELCKKDNALKKQLCCRIYFGLNDYTGFQTGDIPPMRIKDIRINENGKERFYYPLWESEGNMATEVLSGKKVPVKNPLWIKPRHQQWEEVLSITTASTPSFAFSNRDKSLYIVGLDSLYTLSLKNLSLTGTRLVNNRGSMPPGNQSLVSSLNNRLYNFYTDEKLVSEYDTAAHSWSKNFPVTVLTVFWQSNKFISPVDSCLYVVGGYGQLQYKNIIQRYHFATGKWDTVKTTGDFFMPRYLAALGTNQTGDTAYIIGGYGSNTGDQTINPKHNYDVLAYNVKNKSFKLLTHLNEPQRQFCFANSLIVEPGTDQYYALTYPNDRFSSGLQLIKGSLHSNQYELMADSIPYSFYDVESFADLFYDSTVKKLVAVTLNMQKNNTTVVKAYTLDFPPNPVDLPTAPVQETGTRQWLYLGIGILILTVSWWFFRKKKTVTAIPANKIPVTAAGPEVMLPEPVQPAAHKEYSSVFLFGQFEVLDKEGHDITPLFTPLLKEIFLLVLIHTYKDGKGITSEKLFETIWGDKSTKDARNNYSVNSVKLKPILEKIGDCHIERETNKLKLEIMDHSVTIDYQRFMENIAHKQNHNKAHIAELVHLLQRGSFLSQLHYDWLDDIKSEVSGLIIDTLLQYLSTTDVESDPEFIIKIANVIFLSDQLNEEALSYKCRSLIFLGRHGLAKDAYTKFAKEYRENYGQDFEKSFGQVTGHSGNA